ncbi:MAG: VOC family protein [Proteobacteria bacterium]|nr:VOC family protein [Pseudomonadota bacterium]
MTSIAGIGQVSLVTKDLERATNFYRDVIGLEHLFMAGGMSFFNVDGIRLVLGPPGGDFTHGSSILYYRTSDIENEHQRLEAAGVGILEAPQEVFRQQGHALWLAFYADSEGNAFALMEERNDE